MSLLNDGTCVGMRFEMAIAECAAIAEVLGFGARVCDDEPAVVAASRFVEGCVAHCL